MADGSGIGVGKLLTSRHIQATRLIQPNMPESASLISGVVVTAEAMLATIAAMTRDNSYTLPLCLVGEKKGIAWMDCEALENRRGGSKEVKERSKDWRPWSHPVIGSCLTQLRVSRHLLIAAGKDKRKCENAGIGTNLAETPGDVGARTAWRRGSCTGADWCSDTR